MTAPNWQVIKMTHESERMIACPPIMLANKRTMHGALQPSRYGRPQYFLPILLIAKQIDKDHGANGQHKCNVDVARNVCTTGENRQQSQ